MMMKSEGVTITEMRVDKKNTVGKQIKKRWRKWRWGGWGVGAGRGGLSF